jgi:diaminohydroxyphosphoribosylaminopyrimidine deaminase/5-amino-6-(5-phosphoribosylamino)uracil reductase
VLVRDGQVIGEGFHTYDGLHHAEVVALQQAGDAARGATLYINLEPCCHQGRTGPCTDALIAAGVSRVVAAIRDPNPSVSGGGFRALRRAGIAAEYAKGFDDEAGHLNEAFATWITSRRPFVTLKTALTLDRHVVLPSAPDGSTQRWITSPASRTEVHRMRHASDAIMTGIGTVLADNPLLTDRSGMARRRPLLRVIIDSRLRLSPRSKLVRTAANDVLVFTCPDADGARARALRRKGVEIVSVPLARTAHKSRGSTGRSATRVDLKQVMAELAHRDILSVLLEAGPILNDAALALGLVDKVRLFYAPLLVGATDPALADGKNVWTPGNLLEVYDIRIERFGPDFAIEGYLKASSAV